LAATCGRQLTGFESWLIVARAFSIPEGENFQRQPDGISKKMLSLLMLLALRTL
jgi:hypothetical protein